MPIIKPVGYTLYERISALTFDIYPYNVYVDGKLVFSGQSISEWVDIAPLLRDYLTSERVLLDWPINDNGIPRIQSNVGVASINTEWMTSAIPIARIDIRLDYLFPSDIPDGAGFASNDYNNECRTELDAAPTITSVFIRNTVDKRQICFFGANSADGLTFNISTFPKAKKVKTAENYIHTPSNLPVVVFTSGATSFSEQINSCSAIARMVIGETDNTSLLFQANHYDGAESDSIALKIAKCPIARYALYAVNRAGGVTHLICDGKPLESFTRKQWDIETDYPRTDPIARGIKRINTSAVRKWRLNTGYLTEGEAAHIDDLVNSPKIVLHDMEAGRLYAVNNTDTTIERRTRISNGRKPIEYALNFEEARTEIRR